MFLSDGVYIFSVGGERIMQFSNSKVLFIFLIVLFLSSGFHTLISEKTDDNDEISETETMDKEKDNPLEPRWSIQTPDSNGFVGFHSSLALDSSDYPHISYNGNNHLKYAYWNGSDWTIETVDNTDYGGYYTSLALDSSNHPHISYYTDMVYNLKYAYWDGSDWSIEIVDNTGDLSGDSSLALDCRNHPHISYYDSSNDLKYAYWNGSDWSIETVDSEENVGMFTSLALDSSNHPHISYDGDGYLNYAFLNGSVWSYEKLDYGCGGGYPSLALDSSNHPHISYYDSLNDNLKYAYWNGSDWSIETVDSSTNFVGFYTSLKLDSSDNPHISYYEYSYYDELKYTYWNGSDWTIETVDSSRYFDYGTSLALNSTDYAHISYCDYSADDLKYARKTDSENQPPVADFNYWYIFPNINQTINFTDTSYDPVGYIVDWYWDFGDGTTSTLQHPSHNYSTAGVYTVELTVTDNDGESDTHSKLIPIGIEELYLLNDVYSGWNFFSISFNDSFDKNDLLLMYDDYFYDVGYLFGWNRLSQSYEFADILYPGYGYWFYSIDDGDIFTVDINHNNGNYITTVEEGWNIVGIPDNIPFPVYTTDILVDNESWNTSVSNGWISDVLFDWDEQGQSYAFSDSFVAFEAYWLYAYKECILTLDI